MDGRDPSSTLGGEPGILDRARGALLGLAVGDALGASCQYGPRIATPKDYLRDLVGGGPFDLEPGQFTGNTSQALAMGKSLALRKGLDPTHAAGQLLGWYRRGEGSPTGRCFDIGGPTRRALERFEADGQPFQGSGEDDGPGDAPLARVVPAAIFGLDSEAEAIRVARDGARLTHVDPASVDASGYLIQLLRLLLRGEEDHLKLALVGWTGHPDMVRAKAAIWNGLPRKDVRSTGGSAASFIEASLWAFSGSRTFEQAVVLAANLGGDSSTIAAITGALAGAQWGERAIPRRWLDALAMRHKLGALALSLVRTSSEVHIHGA